MQFSKARAKAVLYWVEARLPGPLRHGTGYDNGGPDTGPTEIHTGRSFWDIGTVPNSCPDDRGLGTV